MYVYRWVWASSIACCKYIVMFTEKMIPQEVSCYCAMQYSYLPVFPIFAEKRATVCLSYENCCMQLSSRNIVKLSTVGCHNFQL